MVHWRDGSIFLIISFILLSFNIWIRWGEIAPLSSMIQKEKNAMANIVKKEEMLLDADLRKLFEEYSAGILSVEAIFSARDEVFSGSWDEKTYEPLLLLDYIDFFEKLKKLLSKHSVISNLSIDSTGKISFLIQSTSYLNAARQIAGLRLGFSEPHILADVVISSVSKNEIIGEAHELPEVLRKNDSIYEFIVQAKINPEYYSWMQEGKEDGPKGKNNDLL